MDEETILKAAKLLDKRRVINLCIKKGFIDELKTKSDWNLGSAEKYQGMMLSAKHEAFKTAEMIMRNRAEACIKEINKELESLGINL